MMTDWKILFDESDVTPEIEEFVIATVDWFDGESMRVEEFIDRLCDTYGGDSFDLESYDSPAARKIMRIARQERRSRTW